MSFRFHPVCDADYTKYHAITGDDQRCFAVGRQSGDIGFDLVCVYTLSLKKCCGAREHDNTAHRAPDATSRNGFKIGYLSDLEPE